MRIDSKPRQRSRAAVAVIISTAMLLASELCCAQASEREDWQILVVDGSGAAVQGALVAGRFRLRDAIETFGRSDAEGVCRIKVPPEVEHVKVYARADGYGVVDASVSSDDLEARQPLRLQLPRAASISGQLLDPQGLPATGVRIRPYRVVKFERGRSLAEAMAGAKWIRDVEQVGWPVLEVKVSSESLLPWVETDQDGRFTVDSVGPDQLVGLFAISELFAATTIVVRTDEGLASTIGTERGEPDIEVHPRTGFQHTVASSTPIIGRVIAVDTGAAVSGATVSPWRAPGFGFHRAEELMAVHTDQRGNYLLSGMPAGKWRIFAAPPADQNMVAVERRVEIVSSGAQTIVDYTMPTGVTVAGHVTDRNSGEPVPGTISYFAFSDNPHLQALEPSSISTDQHSATVDEQGMFQFTVLPGPGILTFMASTSVSQNYRRGIGWDRIDHHIFESNGNHTMFRTEPHVLTAYNCTQLFEVDIPEKTGDHRIDFVVGEKRTDVPLKFTTESGEPIPSSIYYSNATPDNYSFQLFARNAARPNRREAVISFFDGNKPRVVQARARGHELAGWLWVSAGDAVATIELKPASSIRGRVLRADGSPVVDAALNTPYFYDPTTRSGVIPSQPDEGYYPHTDDKGEFKFVGLPANLPLTVMIDQKDEARNVLLARHYLFEDVELKPGDTLDLGDLRIDELREWTPGAL